MPRDHGATLLRRVAMVTLLTAATARAAAKDEWTIRPLDRRDASWADINPNVVIIRRGDQYDCSKGDLGHYDKGLHIAAIFIVLATSAIGVAVPIISARRSRKNQASGTEEQQQQQHVDAQTGKGRGFLGNVFFIAKHFGSGVIFATAFVHLLHEGFTAFANPCIGHLAFDATSSALALAGAFVTFLLDFSGSRFLASQQTYQSKGKEADEGEKDDTAAAANTADLGSSSSLPPTPTPQTLGLTMTRSNHHPTRSFFDFAQGHDHHHHLSSEAGQDEKWQVFLLEAGIIFHSIMIGVTLGATGGDGWKRLLIVIVFHQFFEGLALGARVGLLSFASWWRPCLMGLAFSLITPIGIAIGVGVHGGFAENGKAALLSVGVLNSFSAGILLYPTFQMLTADYITGPLRDAPFSRVAISLTSMVAGMICMSVLGKWA